MLRKLTHYPSSGEPGSSVQAVGPPGRVPAALPVRIRASSDDDLSDARTPLSLDRHQPARARGTDRAPHLRDLRPEGHAQRSREAQRRPQQQASILVSVDEDIRKLKNPPVARAIGFVARSPKRN